MVFVSKTVLVASNDTCTDGGCFLDCNRNNDSNVTGFYSTNINDCVCVSIATIVREPVELLSPEQLCRFVCIDLQSHIPSLYRSVTGFEAGRDDNHINCTCVDGLNREITGQILVEAIRHHLGICNNKIAMFREMTRTCVLENDFTGKCLLWSRRSYTSV